MAVAVAAAVVKFAVVGMRFVAIVRGWRWCIAELVDDGEVLRRRVRFG